MKKKHKNPMKRANWKVIRYLEKLSYELNDNEHFNPQKYCSNIDEKLQQYKTSRRSKFVANFHIVFVTRGRVQILFKEVRTLIKQFLKEEIEINNWDSYAIEVMSNHIHLFVSLDNKASIPKFVGKIRRKVMNKILLCFPILKKALGEELFSHSYYSGTIGNVTGFSLMNYISKQWEEEKKERYYQFKKNDELKNLKLTSFF